MPHIQRGLQLHRRLVTSEGLVETLADAVDVTAHAVLLVNAAGRVTFMNRAATQLAGNVMA
jgi:PAS domain-containing protein